MVCDYLDGLCFCKKPPNQAAKKALHEAETDVAKRAAARALLAARDAKQKAREALTAAKLKVVNIAVARALQENKVQHVVKKATTAVRGVIAKTEKLLTQVEHLTKKVAKVKRNISTHSCGIEICAEFVMTYVSSLWSSVWFQSIRPRRRTKRA